MANANKRKGTVFESAVRDYAQRFRHRAFRPAQVSAGDIGDVHIDGLVCVQAKDHAQHRFGEWVADAKEQAMRAGLPFGVVVAKRRRASIGESYVVMDLDTFLAMVKRIHTAEALLPGNPFINSAYKRALTEGEIDEVFG
jgi:hypothetical protein